MKNRFWLISGFLGVVAGLLILLFLVWRPVLEREKKVVISKKELAAAPTAERKTAPKEIVSPLPIKVGESPKMAEIPSFFEIEKEKITEEFLGPLISPAILPVAPFTSPLVLSPQIPTLREKQAVSPATTTETMPTEIVLSLTDEEFHYLYPDSFIKSLLEAQELFIKEYDSTYQPLSEIKTDSQIRFVEEKLVSSLLEGNWITKEEAERYITTIRVTLPQLQLQELKNRKSSSVNEFAPMNLGFFQPPSKKKGLFFAGLMEKIYSALIPRAEAKVCGICVSLPECWQVGFDVSLKPGVNVWKAFCYCTGCFWGQGCLDFCYGRSAIWDKMTGICGCG